MKNPKKLRISAVDLNEGSKVGELNLGLIELLSYVKHHLHQKNFKIDIEYIDNSEILKNIKNREIVLISSKGFELEKKKKIIAEIRLNNGLTILGGPGVTAKPSFGKFSDISIIGEGEYALLKILKLWIKFNKNKMIVIQNFIDVKKEFLRNYVNSLKRIENLIINYNGSLFKTKRKYYDEIDFVRNDFSLVNIEKYIKNWDYMGYEQNVRGISIITSRSCPHLCSFCQPTVWEIFGKKLKFKPLELVFQELIELNQKYGINAFALHDDTFTIKKRRVLEFAKGLYDLRKKGIKFKWICNTRADRLDDEIVYWLKKSGCIEIRLGIETLDENIRNNFLSKNLKDEDIIRAIKLIKRHNIKILGFFMLGFPKKTAFETLKELLEISKMDLDMISLNILTPLPGTYLGEKFMEKHFYSYYSVNKAKITNISDFTLELLRKIGIIIFYFNPLVPSRLKNTFSIIFNFRRMRNLYFIIKRFLGIKYE